MIKTLCMIITLGFACRAPVVNKTTAFIPTTSAANPACTWQYIPNGTCPTCTNIVLGPGCTIADIFKDAANGDFHLAAGLGSNPAIGNAQCLPNQVPTDKDGNPRPTPGRPIGQGCDVGAYQFTGPSPPSTLKAQFLNVTGQDLVGMTTFAPDGILDWHFLIQGLRSTPDRYQLFSDGGGIWETPFNAAGNWVIYVINEVPLADWFVDPIDPQLVYHLKVFYSDGSTDETDATFDMQPQPPTNLRLGGLQ